MSGPGYSRWPRQHSAHSCARAGPPRLSDDQSLSRLLLLDPEAQPGCPLETPRMIGGPHVPHSRKSRSRASAIASILTSRDRLGCATLPTNSDDKNQRTSTRVFRPVNSTHDTISARKTGGDSLILSAKFPRIGPADSANSHGWRPHDGKAWKRSV